MKTAAVQMNMLVIGGGFLHLAWLGKTEVARLWVNLHRVENLNNRANGKLNDSLHFARNKEMVKKTLLLNILFDFDFKKELQWKWNRMNERIFYLNFWEICFREVTNISFATSCFMLHEKPIVLHLNLYLYKTCCQFVMYLYFC